MLITYSKGLFRATGAADPVALEMQGWRHLHGLGQYVTASPLLAARYRDHADPDAKRALVDYSDSFQNAVKQSAALDSDIYIPAPPGLAYRPYQRAGIAYAKDRPRALIGDAMRLGKTIQAIGVLNCKEELNNVLVVCPATAKYNWERELKKWLVHDLSVGVAEGSKFPDTSVVVINYDIMSRHVDALTVAPWDVAIFDECHALKNPRAARTKIVYGFRKKPRIMADQKLFLSGTALFKTPVDLWTVCHECDPKGLGQDWMRFVYRYCNAKKTRFGLDTSGAANLEELQFRMRSKFMIRREKGDVVAEIEPKRETILLPKTGLEKIVRDEAKVVRDELGGFAALLNGVMDEAAVDEIVNRYSHLDGVERDDDEEVTEHLSVIRRELALAKLPMCIEHLNGLLEDEPKIVIFAHHRDVIHALRDAFPGSAVVYGGMTAKKKDDEVVRFQSDPDCRVLIGNIISAGQAINLSIANVVAFVELSWVPAEMDQAEERVWDVLKTQMNWIFRYVVEDSLDERMVTVLDRRQKNIGKAMNINALAMENDHVDADRVGEEVSSAVPGR